MTLVSREPFFLPPSVRGGAAVGAAAALAVVASSYVAAMIFGTSSLPDLLQPTLLAALPGPVFGFLIDNLQHVGKVAEETGLVSAIVAMGAVAGMLVAVTSRRAPVGPRAKAADPSRRRLLLLAPPVIGGAALAIVTARLVPEWYRALRPPEGATGEVPAITPASSFYLVSKNFRDPIVPLAGWRLRVHGLVERELFLGYPDLASMPQASEIVTLECVSNPVGGRLMSTGRFEGPRVMDLVQQARPMTAAGHVAFRANDGYSESLPLEELRPEMLIALTLNGVPLPNEHGFPARMLVPGRYGMKGPKWLEAIELVADPVVGYWEGKGWNPSAVVKTTSRIDVPADGARVSGSAIRLEGIAFAGSRGISEVDWTEDGGSTWHPAGLDAYISPFSWRLWNATWRPSRPAPYILMVRATDGTGVMQDSLAISSFPGGSSGLDAIRVTVTS